MAADSRRESTKSRGTARWLRRFSYGLTGTVLVIGVLYASHPLTLPLMADLLVVDVATDEGQLAFPLDGAAAVKWVAEAVRAGRVQMVGLSRRRPSRLVERRLLPDPWDQTNQDLDRQGVSADRRSCLRWWMQRRSVPPSVDSADPE